MAMVKLAVKSEVRFDGETPEVRFIGYEIVPNVGPVQVADTVWAADWEPVLDDLIDDLDTLYPDNALPV